MSRLTYLAILSTSLLGACGDDGGSTMMMTDAPGMTSTDVGFNKPAMAIHANMQSGSTWTDLGVADMSCLNTPTADKPRTTSVALTSKIVDFQYNDKVVTGATVVAFAGTDPTMTLGSPATSGADGSVSFTIPTNANPRIGFKMTGGMAGNDVELETYLMNQYLDPDAATQSISEIQDVSMSTANLLPAVLGKDPVPGTGEIAGAFRDCAGHEVSNFVATFSSTKDTATPVDGGDSYYFSLVPLPVKHMQAESSNQNGLFLTIRLPPGQGYVQLWGYLTDADKAADKLTLLSQLQAPIVANAVVTGSFEPLRTN